MSSLSRRLVLLPLLLCPTIVTAQDQRAVLELIVNRVPSGEAIVFLRGDDALVSADSLQQAGLKPVNGRGETISGKRFVSLASLAPSVDFFVDVVELRLILTVNPELLGLTVRTLSSGAPADMVHRKDTSGYVNYSANWHSNRQFDVFAESATSVRGVSVYNTLAATDQSVTRGLTSVTLDQRSRLRRWTVGDSFASGGALGGDAWFAGLSVKKDFTLDPYYVRYPRLSLSTPISMPSVMEVYVNGQVVAQERVMPGQLDLRNLPLTMGRNDARVVVRDAFGETQELSTGYYLATTALARGVQDYQYSVGLRRVGIGARNWDYREPVVLARHRVGISESLTAGGRFELEPGRFFSGGPSMNLRLPFGEIETAASFNRRDEQWGTAALGSFAYVGRGINAGGSVTVASPKYETLTTNPVNEQPRRQASVFAGVTVTRGISATLQHTQTETYQGVAMERSSVLSSLHLSRSMDGIVSVSRVTEAGRTHGEAFAGVTVSFGRSSASVAAVRDSRGERLTFESQQSMPTGTGHGYQFQAAGGPDPSFNGVGRYQNAHGRYEVRQQTFGSESRTTLSAMGGLVGIGGALFATRPVQDSFALVRVPDVKGVRAFASHQEIGTTGRRGDLLVPNLQAYYGNILDIADGDIPLEYDVPSVGLTLAPPYRGGAIALFNVQRVQRVLGRLEWAADDRSYVYGELTVIGADGQTQASSPIGSDGVFYFQNLSVGTHSAVAVKDGGQCRATLTVPASGDTVIKIGVVRCTTEGKQP